MAESAPLLVTGGTGFLGSALLPRLVAAGREVHVLARTAAPREHLDGLPLIWHAGDLLDPPSVVRAVAAVAERAHALGARADLIHGAALISYRREHAELSWRVNVDATRTLLDAAGLYRLGRVVFVSSVVTVGCARDPGVVLDEDAPFDGARLRSAYVDTKRAAEDLVLARAGELDAVVVNPAAVFGPAPTGSNTLELLRRTARGTLGPFAPPGTLSVVGVEDAAEGVLLALERGRRGRRYLLLESCWSHLELMRLVAGKLGRRGPRLRLPGPLWSALTFAAGALDRLHASDHVNAQTFRLLGAHFRLDAARAREELGWTPRPFEAVLEDTLAWMRTRGLLA